MSGITHVVLMLFPQVFARHHDNTWVFITSLLRTSKRKLVTQDMVTSHLYHDECVYLLDGRKRGRDHFSSLFQKPHRGNFLENILVRYRYPIPYCGLNRQPYPCHLKGSVVLTYRLKCTILCLYIYIYIYLY